MKKNKLTLKALNQELELLKSTKSTKATPKPESHKSRVAQDIKNSYIQNLHMKSSMFLLWIVSTVLAYAHKIPYIKNVIGLLSLYYGRTTIWKVLVKIRKLFIFFNAAIGVYMVFKTTGFGYDTFLSNFCALGNTYLEIFINFTKRLFHWFFELFDHKIVPNVPTTPSSPKSYRVWSPWGYGNTIDSVPNISRTNAWVEQYLNKPITKEWLNPAVNININPTQTSWYKDIYNLLGVSGLLSVTAASVGIIYFGYKLVADPLFIENITNWFKSTNNNDNIGNIPTTQIHPVSPTGSDITITQSLLMLINGNIKRLNPLYWLTSTPQNELVRETNAFAAVQATQNYNPSLYPYTSVNPFAPWYEKLRLSWLGETTGETLARNRLKQSYLDSLFPFLDKALSPVASTSYLSPGVGSLGLSTGEGYYGVLNKFSSVPTTPTLSPLALNTSTLPNINPFDNTFGDAIDRLTTNNNSNELDDIIPLQLDWVVSNNGKHK